MAYEKQNFENNKVLKAEHLNHMEDGIEAAQTLIVHLNEDGVTADHTGPQIREHVASGGSVAFNPYGQSLYTFSHIDGDTAFFAEMCDDMEDCVHMIGADGRYEMVERTSVNQDTYNTDMGNIVSALDAIIAMQEELIGS